MLLLHQNKKRNAVDQNPTKINIFLMSFTLFLLLPLIKFNMKFL